MKKSSIEAYLYSTIGVLAVFAILVGFNVVSGAVKTRVDLTKERAYTLSAGTRAILSKLDTPIKLRFYSTQVETATPDTVFLRNFAQQVDDLLDELRQASGGKLIVERYNPAPDSDAEDSAKLDGLEGQPLPPYGEPYYLGLAVSQLDQKVAIPFLSPTRERLLEYDIMRAISQVMTDTKPVVGVMSALPVHGAAMNPMMMRMGQQGQEPWVFISELKRDFTVREVPMTAEKIDDDIRVLLVIYPKDITDAAQFAIDQFVLRGGKLIALLDPMSIADNRNAMQNPLQRATSGGATLDKLLKAWGLEFDANKVVSDMNYKYTAPNRPEPVPTILALTQEAVATNEVLTSQIDSLLVPYAGVFTGSPREGLTQTVLLKTSANSDMTDKVMAEFGGGAKEFKPSGKEYPLALRLAGKFKTAFPDGKPAATPPAPAAEGEKKEEEKSGETALKESTSDGVVILVGDSDWVYDPVCVQVQNIFGQRIVIPQAGNLNLAQGMVEQLAGDSNLIAVRSRATLNRPFTVVKKMEERAQEAYRSKIKQLEDGLAETQQRLNELQRTKQTGQTFVLSAEQQQEIVRFRQEEAKVKKELKELRKNLRKDVDALETRLKWINIAGMPILVSLSGILLALRNRKKTAAK